MSSHKNGFQPVLATSRYGSGSPGATSPRASSPRVMRQTTRRTAAASALAADYLARKDATDMVMVGSGAMAPQLIKAHASVRPAVYVLGRALVVVCTSVESVALASARGLK